MRCFVTLIPSDIDMEDWIPGEETRTSVQLGDTLNFVRAMIEAEIPTRLVITNMRRERPGFVKASELDRDD